VPNIEKVSAGEPLKIRASEWNLIAEAVADYLRKKAGNTGATGPASSKYGQPVEIQIRNDTGSDLSIHSILKVGSPLVSAIDYPFEFLEPPVFGGSTPAATTDLVAVTQDPIPDGELGRAILLGVAICTVDVVDSGHGYAEPTASSAAKLTSATTGPIRIIWKDSGTGDKTAVVLLQSVGSSGDSLAWQEDSVVLSDPTFINVLTSGGLNLVPNGSGQDLTTIAASATQQGTVTTGSQHFAGTKGFSDGINVYDINGSRVVTSSTTPHVTLTGDIVLAGDTEISGGANLEVTSGRIECLVNSITGQSVYGVVLVQSGDTLTNGEFKIGYGGAVLDGYSGVRSDGLTIRGGIVTDPGTAGTGYTAEVAQDDVAGMFLDTSTIDVTYTDATPSVEWAVKSSSITSTHLADDAVTLAKIANIANQRILANGSGASASPTETQISSILDWVGSTRGDLLYRGASSWSRLAAGTSGQIPRTLGSSADPVYVNYAIAAINGFRLSGSSTLAVPTADISSTSTIYLQPYTSDDIALYDGSLWYPRSTAGAAVSLALSGLTSGKVYDVFAYWTGSAVALELSAAWTNDTTRADALTQVNGVWVKSGTTTRRHVGYFYSASTTTTKDTETARHIISRDNPVERVAEARPGYADDNAVNSISFSSNQTYKRLNAGTNDTIDFLAPLSTRKFNSSLTITATVNAGDQIRAGISIDSTTNPKNTCAISAVSSQVLLTVSIHHDEPLGLAEGRHYSSILATMTNANTATVWSDLQRYGASADPKATYLSATIWG
jgi:hypothetical protein